MIPARRTARQRLKQATRTEYDSLIFEAKLTPAQKQILDLHFLQDLPICEIAFRLSWCESLVRKRLAGTMTITPAAAEEFFNISRAINAAVFAGCCESISVVNTSDQPILVQNANIIISRPDLAVSR